MQADACIVYLGGKAGRLGESVVATGLLESLLQAFTLMGKTAIPIHICVEPSVSALFVERLYQEKYWPNIIINVTSDLDTATDNIIRDQVGQHIVIIDLHGGHDGMPYLEISPKHEQQEKQISRLDQLFRVGFRSYAQRGPERRYADFFEELLVLPPGSIDGKQAQPRILLAVEEQDRYSQLCTQLGITTKTVPIVCFFQSVVLAKCYELWDEVLHLLSVYFARHYPEEHLTFILACGPERDLPRGFSRADMEEWLADFTGVNGNAHVLITAIPSLRDVAILVANALLVLSNDTGPGHIAGAVQTPTVIPFLPGNIYAKHIWSSSLWQHGVTREPNPYSYQQLEAAVIWGKTDIINSIAPQNIFQTIYQQLPKKYRQQEP